jgi:hypothetical protein
LEFRKQRLGLTAIKHPTILQKRQINYEYYEIDAITG